MVTCASYTAGFLQFRLGRGRWALSTAESAVRRPRLIRISFRSLPGWTPTRGVASRGPTPSAGPPQSGDGWLLTIQGSFCVPMPLMLAESTLAGSFAQLTAAVPTAPARSL